jgi:hypothetical protein
MIPIAYQRPVGSFVGSMAPSHLAIFGFAPNPDFNARRRLVHSRYGLHACRVAKRPSTPEAPTASLSALPLRLLPGANQFCRAHFDRQRIRQPAEGGNHGDGDCAESQCESVEPQLRIGDGERRERSEDGDAERSGIGSSVATWRSHRAHGRLRQIN